MTGYALPNLIVGDPISDPQLETNRSGVWLAEAPNQIISNQHEIHQIELPSTAKGSCAFLQVVDACV